MRCYLHFDYWAFLFLLVRKCPRLRPFASLLTLCTFSEITRCSAAAWSRTRIHYLLFGLFLVFFRVAATPLFVLRSEDGQMALPLEAHLNLTWRHLPGRLHQR